MAKILKGILNIYNMVVSPWLGTRCRFTPTCSEYAKQALDQHSVVTATAMTARRICRCHPWGGHGYDPVTAPKITYTQNNTLDIKEKT